VARLLLIANPVAARTKPATLAKIVESVRRAGWQVEPVQTSGPGDARILAEQGVRGGADVVAVFGGDGTTMQAAAALVGTDIPLGLIAGGTGNLLARNLRLPTDPVRAARVIVSGKPRPYDLGRLVSASGEQYFAVACGAGYDARVMTATVSRDKRRWGMLAYVATTFRLLGKLRSSNHRITVDGKLYETKAAMLLVANCAEVIPPFIRMGPSISPDDGVLDVVALRADSFADGVRAAAAMLRAGGAAPTPAGYVGWLRGREIRVESDPVEPIQLDGDAGGETPFTATVAPGAIRIVLPGR
jgi:YegS/Rv2252/BmrU family lipid kinase